MHESIGFAATIAAGVTTGIKIGGMFPSAPSMLLLQLPDHPVPQFPPHGGQVEPRQLLRQVAFKIGQQLGVGLILKPVIIRARQFIHLSHDMPYEVFLQVAK